MKRKGKDGQQFHTLASLDYLIMIVHNDRLRQKSIVYTFQESKSYLHKSHYLINSVPVFVFLHNNNLLVNKNSIKK